MEAGAITTWNSWPLFGSSILYSRNTNFPKTPSSYRISTRGVLPFSCNPTILRVPRCSQQAKFSEGNADRDKIMTSKSALSLGKRLLNFARANFLPIALTGAVGLGMICPSLGCQASRYSILNYSTFGIFFISGLKLNDGELGEISKAWPAIIYGLASVLLFSPLLSRLILKVQLMPQEFSTGLAIFSCMPTTLTSGVALTQIVGGNSALALALTVMSNTLGILVVPLWVSKFLADGFGVRIPTWPIFWDLFIILLVPLFFGKTPWIQVSKSRSLLLIVEPKVFLAAILMGILVHLGLLAFNTLSVKCMSAQFGDCKSVFAKKENARVLIMVCSQKALLIAVTVVGQLNGALGNSGLLVIPCVAAHINQIIIDSFLVNLWLQKDEKLKVKEKP